MADVKISALPLASTPLTGTEVLPIVQSATTDQVTVANLTAGRAVSASSLTLTTTPLAVGSGGTGLTSLTAGYIPFGAGTSAFGNASTFVFDGTNLGVGTGSPVSFGAGYTNLQLNATSGCFLTQSVNGTRTGYFYTDVSGSEIGTLTNSFFRIYTNSSERMRIASDGSVGIGTTSPSYKLDVRGNIAGGNGTIVPGFTWTTRGVVGTFSNHSLGFMTNSIEQMYLDTSGNLGLGNTANERVGIFSSTTNCYQQFVDSSNGGTSGAYGFFIGITSGEGQIRNKQNSPVTFYTNNTERARIDASGNLLVGTTTANSIYKFKTQAASGICLGIASAVSVTGALTISCVNDTDTANIPLDIRASAITASSGIGTTASAANAFFDNSSNNKFLRSTSALKYKTNIRDLESIDINVFRPVRYNSKCDADNPTIDHFGIIADEVDAAGIKELVTYGADGEVEGFQYERLTVVILKNLQELAAKVAELEAKI